MKLGFKTVFKFSFLRIIKNKMFIILTTLTLLLIALFQGLAMGIGQDVVYKAEIVIIPIIVLGIFWLSFVNIQNTVKISVTDTRNGLQSLQKRRGINNSTLFFAKFLPLKIVTTTFIIITFAVFCIVTSFFPIPLKDFVIGRLGIGIFSLIAFDWFIFGLSVLVSSSTKSLKKTLPITWIISTFWMFFAIFGPIVFAFSGGGFGIDYEYSVSTKNKWYLQQTQTKDANFLSKLASSKYELEEELRTNINFESNEYEEGIVISEGRIINVAMSKGMILEFGNLIENDKFDSSLEWYLNQFGTNMAEQRVTIDTKSLQDAFKDNLYYNFLKSAAISSKGDKTANFKNSYFHKISQRNFSGPQQLKEVLDNLDKNIKDKYDISELEFNTLVDSINDLWRFDMSPFSNYQLFPSSWSDSEGDKLNYFVNYSLWVEDTKFSPGTHLFSMLMGDVASLLTSIIDEETEPWYVDLKLNYQINPFMLFYEMVYFTGTPNIHLDALMTSGAPLGLSEFNFMEIEDGELVYSGRPFIVWLNYLVFIGLGLGFTSLGYLAFVKPRDERKQVD